MKICVCVWSDLVSLLTVSVSFNLVQSISPVIHVWSVRGSPPKSPVTKIGKDVYLSYLYGGWGRSKR